MHQYFEAPTWLLDPFVKTTLLLAIVWLGSLFLQKRSAAAQHRWWTLGFVGCLLIPLLSPFMPTWTPPLIPTLIARPSNAMASVSRAAPSTPINRRVNDARPLANDELRGEGPERTELSSAPKMWLPDASPNRQLRPEPQNKKTSQVEMTPEPTSTDWSTLALLWSRTFFMLWGGGVVVVLSRTVRQHWLLQRMLMRCADLNDTEWDRLLTEASRMLGLRGKVKLIEYSDASSPMTAGIWRPVVILPADARDWNRERRRLVLLHELAHVRRKDVLAQMVAGLGCGLHWFNPLAWYGLLQMRKLREVACDDLVLGSGQRATGYADVLLAIARTYRHQTYPTAVGMAHTNDVESRIMAILDQTRRHVAMSRTAARMLFVFAATLVCLVGTAQFRSQAESPTPGEANAIEEAASSGNTKNESDDEQLRMMQIRILDGEGSPLKDAMLRVGVWYPEGYDGYRTPKEHRTDANGVVKLRLPKRLDILRLWPKQIGYVGQFKNFGRGTHREGQLIPDEFEFRLTKGHPIGGRIVDAQGNPVEGVHVRVKVDDAPGVSTWLTDSFGQPTVKTDSNGRWQLRNAPAPREKGPDCSFELKLSHDDYVTDKYWGESQRAQGVGTVDLRRGNATIVLHQGTSIHGTVVDEAGNPITKGWVVWSDEPYFSDGVLEDEIEAGGIFRTPPLPEGEFPITIVAPGFAAQRRVVEVGSDPSEQRFVLRAGKRITIRVVDTAGNPVPKVGVYLANSSSPITWQDSNALHNHKHPNVPDYGIPRHADENGVFEWDWAPEEVVRYDIQAKGFAEQEVALVAKQDPHIVTLAGARVAAGQVTDASTGKPLKEFQAMPVIVFRPDFYSTRFADMKRGTDGRYELPLTGSGDPNDRYRVRFEADGYRSVVSEESFGPLDGRVELNVRLEPAPMRKGRVLDANGKPVVDARVMEGTPTWVPHTRNGEPSGFRERVGQTDADGRFKLHATSEPVRLRIVHDDGFVERLIQPEEDSIGDLQLRPWAKVSGRLIQNGQPIGNQSVFYNALVRRGLGEARFQDSYSAQTAPDGSFAFDRIPPGPGSVRPYLGPWRDSPLTSGESLTLELTAGEQRELVLGGEGAVITGQVVATGRDEVPLDRQYSLNYLVSRDQSIRKLPADFPVLSFDPSAPMQPSWSLDSHFNDWLATRENHFVKLTAEGDLRVTGVAPGEYDLLIRLYEQPAGCLVETVGEKIIPIHVQGDGEIKLGRIEVPCRSGPRPGTDMGVFEFVDTTGKAKSIYDMAGRHVLMHVWASWCTPCIESMPDIQDMADRTSDQAVTFVGLNIDEVSAQASELAKQMDWNWSQNYLGGNSDMARQLAISSVPTYYLIGPDGKLVASASEWSEIKKQLEVSLATNQ